MITMSAVPALLRGMDPETAALEAVPLVIDAAAGGPYSLRELALAVAAVRDAVRGSGVLSGVPVAGPDGAPPEPGPGGQFRPRPTRTALKERARLVCLAADRDGAACLAAHGYPRTARSLALLRAMGRTLERRHRTRGMAAWWVLGKPPGGTA